MANVAGAVKVVGKSGVVRKVSSPCFGKPLVWRATTSEHSPTSRIWRYGTPT